MNLDNAKKILIARALEEADDQELVVSSDDKARASRLAGAPLAESTESSEEDSFFSKRSEQLLQILSGRFPSISIWLDQYSSGHRFGLFSLGIIVIAAIAGFLTNELGPEKRINILAFPLIGIIVWNLFVYLAEIVLLLRPKNQLFESGMIHGLVNYLICRPKENPDSPEEFDPKEQLVSRAKGSFENQWVKLQIPVWGAKLKSILHLTALILAGAAIAGMYVKGLANEYLAVWESTFFQDGSALRPFLNAVLGPAAGIFGDSIPSAIELNDIHLQAENIRAVGENAARWIHWYATTIAIYVLIPRAVLTIIWRIKATREAHNIPFRSVSPRYFDRLVSISSGKSLPITVLPYAHEPGDRIRRKVLLETENLFSRPIALSWEKPIAFGEEEELDLGSPEEERGIMLLFNFAATPERETHLTLFHSLLQFQHTDRYHILLDAEAFDKKSSAFSDGDKRREERLLAWENLFSGENCDIQVISA